MKSSFSKVASDLGGLYMLGLSVYDLVNVAAHGSMYESYKGRGRTLYWPDDWGGIVFYLAMYLVVGAVCLWGGLFQPDRGESGDRSNGPPQ